MFFAKTGILVWQSMKRGKNEQPTIFGFKVVVSNVKNVNYSIDVGSVCWFLTSNFSLYIYFWIVEEFNFGQRSGAVNNSIPLLLTTLT